MAEPISIQQLKDASLDVKSLEEVVNGDENVVVTTRLGETYPSVKGSIKKVFENGGLPATPFATKALMTASALVDGDYAMVTDDTANNGLYLKTAGAWVKSSYDPLTQAKTYSDANPLFKPKRLTATDNLDDFITSGEYHKYGSGDIADGKNYPVKLSGSLRVEATASNAVVQKYVVHSSGAMYIRTKTSAWTDWVLQLSTKNVDSIIDGKIGGIKTLEWQALSNTKVTTSGRTLTISGYVLAAYQNPLGRIRINDISVTLSGDYDVCFLDLNKLGTVTDITSENYTDYLFVGSYISAGDLQYRAKLGQIPLFKFDSAKNKIVPCAGFVDIDNANSGITPISPISGVVEFKKTADMLDVYFHMASGNKLNIGFKYFSVAATPTSDPSSNTDLWRIYKANRCNNDYVSNLEIVSGGELELAIMHAEDTQDQGVSKDHVGGFHGDEVLTKIDFYVDGVRKDAGFVQSDITSASEIQAVQHSVIYYQNTLRPLADHVKVITFKDGVVNVTQRLDFKYEATQLKTAWTTMLPILRVSASDSSVQITDMSSRSDDYYSQLDNNSTTLFEQRYTAVKNGSVFKQWLSNGTISAETTLARTAGFNSEQDAYISNSPNYNKLYVSALKSLSGGALYDVPKDTVWEWETEYKIKC